MKKLAIALPEDIVRMIPILAILGAAALYTNPSHMPMILALSERKIRRPLLLTDIFQSRNTESLTLFFSLYPAIFFQSNAI